MMPKIKDFGEFQIWIFFEDEQPPHFHVRGPDVSAKLRIDDLMVIAGALPPKVRRRVRKWASTNRGLLVDKWDEFS